MSQLKGHATLRRWIIATFLLSVVAFGVERLLERRAVKVQGLVIRSVTEQNLLGGERASRIVVAYSIAGYRRNLVFARGLIERLSGDFEPGARVPVLVAPNDPNNARLGTRFHVYKTTMCLALVTMTFMSIRGALVVKPLVRLVAKPLVRLVVKPLVTRFRKTRADETREAA